jgi:hypothetical protein
VGRGVGTGVGLGDGQPLPRTIASIAMSERAQVPVVPSQRNATFFKLIKRENKAQGE